MRSSRKHWREDSPVSAQSSKSAPPGRAGAETIHVESPREEAEKHGGHFSGFSFPKLSENRNNELEWQLLDHDGVMVLSLRDPARTESANASSNEKHASPAAAFVSQFCEWPEKKPPCVSSRASVAPVEDSRLPPCPPSSSVQVRLATFDMDDTLVTPKNGSVFAKKGDPTDWKWVSPNVPIVLRALSAAGYVLVIFTNQAGIGQGSGKGWDAAAAAGIQQKLLAIREALGPVPFMAVVSTGKNRWRKPNTSMWQLAEEMVRREVLSALHHVYGDEVGRGGVALSVNCRHASFYCGDAAGRVQFETLAGRKKDFSCADRKFAHNLGIDFYVPEQIFGPPRSSAVAIETDTAVRARLFRRGTDKDEMDRDALQRLPAAAVPFTWSGVDPAVLRQWPTSYVGVTMKVHTFPSGAVHEVTLRAPATTGSTTGLPLLPSPSLCRSDGTQELVLLVGFPGCGKTTFFQRFFAPLGYVHVNRDALGTKAKCLAVTRTAWADGKSVVVDNTNPSSAARLEFIEIVAAQQKLAPSLPLPVRVFIFQHSLEEAMHWNEVRYRSGVLQSRVPAVAFFTFRKQFTPYSEAVMQAERVEAVYEVPPVVCFDGLPAEVATHFYQLSQS